MTESPSPFKEELRRCLVLPGNGLGYDLHLCETVHPLMEMQKLDRHGRRLKSYHSAAPSRPSRRSHRQPPLMRTDIEKDIAGFQIFGDPTQNAFIPYNVVP